MKKIHDPNYQKGALTEIVSWDNYNKLFLQTLSSVNFVK